MTTDPHSLLIRRMKRADLNHSLAWSVRQGWNIGRFDHDCFFETDPQGFFIAEIDGAPVGSVSAVAYDNTFGFIGIYIVRPEFRGKGYGLKLFQAGMEYLGSRNIGLDGVVEQQENYVRSGFRLAYRNIRYGGQASREAEPSECTPMSNIPFDVLCAYDRLHFPAPRPQFLRCWIAQPESIALGVMREGRLAGWGMIRAFVQGYSIAPLFADNPDVADLLFRALSAGRSGADIFLDVPEVNPEAVLLAERHGMRPVFETARMYTGAIPELPMQEIFGVTTFELG